MLNIFKKDTKKRTGQVADPQNPLDPNKMGFLQKMAYKKFMAMSPDEQQKMMAKMLTPENIQKNKKQIMEMFEGLEKSGQMNRHQVFELKKRLGLL